jgi:hypothetical protein
MLEAYAADPLPQGEAARNNSSSRDAAASNAFSATLINHMWGRLWSKSIIPTNCTINLAMCVCVQHAQLVICVRHSSVSQHIAQQH